MVVSQRTLPEGDTLAAGLGEQQQERLKQLQPVPDNALLPFHIAVLMRLTI
jgi:hypothetical protein